MNRLSIVFFLVPAILWLLGASMSYANSSIHGEKAIIGVKMYETREEYQSVFKTWTELGVNTAFVSVSLARDKQFMALAKDNGLMVYVIFPVFYDPDALARDPGLFARNGYGQPARSDWLEFVCPRRPEFLEGKQLQMEQVLAETGVDGLSLDFIRYFIFWEMVYPDAAFDPLQDTCFCRHCLDDWQKESGLTWPADLISATDRAGWIKSHHSAAWTEWKTKTITGVAQRLVNAARQVNSSIRINLHLLPWRQDDFSGALTAVAGQDVRALSKLVDYLSPMCYAHMVKQSPAWIRDVVTDINNQGAAVILPSIQVEKTYRPQELNLDLFKAYLDAALAGPSRGLVIWSWEKLAEDPAKLAAFRTVIRSFKTKG